MEQQLTPEDELWDDSSRVTQPLFHESCGGRVYWIYGDEFRCIKCSGVVLPESVHVVEEV